MTHRSKDGTQIFCTSCWVPKIVPLEFCTTTVRLAEVKRRKSLQARRV